MVKKPRLFWFLFLSRSKWRLRDGQTRRDLAQCTQKEKPSAPYCVHRVHSTHTLRESPQRLSLFHFDFSSCHREKSQTNVLAEHTRKWKCCRVGGVAAARWGGAKSRGKNKVANLEMEKKYILSLLVAAVSSSSKTSCWSCVCSP